MYKIFVWRLGMTGVFFSGGGRNGDSHTAFFQYYEVSCLRIAVSSPKTLKMNVIPSEARDLLVKVVNSP